ncbi:mannitol dehydrogenase family protein [Aurantiacibacter luteus]|uniref:Dioxygenase n=1 Tax=Aurantiacibacter luteus TaxID=1581420 RepID=A0A0G9MKZ3_9SPHN|nr:mannitol dehydrogenase family protein [Aurantiacibacter luteus]KLE31279.1 dioxygenase [Aurantiacibacter luteus]
MRLSQATLGELADGVARPLYDRGQGVGILHFGIGAFHRAQQAWYTDACLNAGEAGWMIEGVSMRSAAVAHQLDPQDGLYTVTERSSGAPRTRVVGSVREVLVAGRDAAAVADRIADAACRIVSFTVTEKGYCRQADGSLDIPLAREGFYPLLADGLARRRAAGLFGLTLLSCDNLSANGRQLSRLMTQYLEETDRDLAAWFADTCRTPDSMVDRIVPATGEDDLRDLEARLGLRDEGAVFTEPFSQWVIEDDFAGPRPGWDDHGAQIVPDVAPFEAAKLRMLNGAHSLLAYAGLDRGHTFVHEAIADPHLRALVEALMADAMPTIAAGPGQDLPSYAEALLARFANPALHHRLAQIAIDGSQKVPQRWLDTLAARQARGLRSPAILTGIAHWLRHVRGDVRAVDDPAARPLAELWHSAGRGGIVGAVFGPGGPLASHWQPDVKDVAAIDAHLDSLASVA